MAKINKRIEALEATTESKPDPRRPRTWKELVTLARTDIEGWKEFMESVAHEQQQPK